MHRTVFEEREYIFDKGEEKQRRKVWKIVGQPLHPLPPYARGNKHISKSDFPLVRMNPNVDAASINFTFQGQLYG